MIKMILFKIKELLKKKGLSENSYRELAQEMGVDHVSLWKILNGKPYNPSLQMLDRFCDFFKCQPGDILEFKRGK